MLKKKNINHYAVIMAGGIGSRFWPLSKTSYPKQFLDILGTGKSLLQQTFDRLSNICINENIYIVTNEIYKEIVKTQLPDLSYDQILCEPARRNTAPCIAYASYKIQALNPNASCIVAPSDHLILKEDVFTDIVNLAFNQAEEKKALLTIGIKPTRPETGYGYIQFSDAHYGDSRLRKVKTFTEKPNLELAEEFISSGDFYWNSGIFIWTINDIIDAFVKHLPEIDGIFKEGKSIFNTVDEKYFIEKAYPVCPNISIDYGIMEKTSNVDVVLGDFGWSDLGTWGSLYTHLQKDKNQNAVVGKEVKLYTSSNNIVNIPKNKTAIIQGLDDYIVVDTPDALLICKKQDEQLIKNYVSELKNQK
jgi:mannose-1-phosphate guanylyltransferase